MNLPDLERRLFAMARAHPPSDRVPYAFEKRVMARLKEQLAGDPWAFWARALWRAAAPCLALTLLLGVWSWLAPANNPQKPDLAQAFENVVLAVADQESTVD